MEVLELDAGEGVLAFSTMRGVIQDEGGSNPYAGFNVCHYTGDDAGHVADCRRELACRVGVPVCNLIIPRQTHSSNVAVVGDIVPCVEDTDALVTCRDDVALVVNTADCLPIVFNDSRHGVIGVAHGGWRGLYDGIIPATVEAMTELGAAAADIRVAIGPCICGGCYEVSEEFAGRFAERFGADVCAVDAASGKPHVDLRRVAVGQIECCGVDRGRIFVADACSRCDERLFSARRMGVGSGRIATVIKKI